MGHWLRIIHARRRRGGRGGMLHSSLCSSLADGFPAGALRLPRLGSRLVASLAKGGFVKILIIFVCGKDYSHWIEWLGKIRSLSSKNGEIHPILGEENVQKGQTVGCHAANNGFDGYHAQYKSGQSLSSNRKRIIINIINCWTGFSQLIKKIARIKNILLSVLL